MRATRGCTSSESTCATSRALRLMSTSRSWRWTWSRLERCCWYDLVVLLSRFASPSSANLTDGHPRVIYSLGHSTHYDAATYSRQPNSDPTR